MIRRSLISWMTAIFPDRSDRTPSRLARLSAQSAPPRAEPRVVRRVSTGTAFFFFRN